jgi:hypothetical protein
VRRYTFDAYGNITGASVPPLPSYASDEQKAAADAYAVEEGMSSVEGFALTHQAKSCRLEGTGNEYVISEPLRQHVRVDHTRPTETCIHAY